jgi:hypothetical protein
MKPLALVALLAFGCEHDPRYDRHVEERPEPAAAVQPTLPAPVVEKTIERPAVTPKIVPLRKRAHRHHH